jgi:hypothetical protein
MNKSKIRKKLMDVLRDIRRLPNPTNQKNQVNYLNIAKKVDGLIRDPQTMRYWRQKVASTLKRSDIREITGGGLNVWFKWLCPLDPHTHIDVLYTLLAFCHDDFLRINCIVTDELKKQSPLLCDQMTIYCVNGIPNSLDIYLSYVERDLAAQQDLQRQQPKEAEKPAETEQGATPAKREKESWLWKLYEVTLKVLVDAVLEWWSKPK